MALTGPGLASAIKAQIASTSPENRDFDAMWDSIGTAIINYIKANATVAVTVTSVSGVTPGGGASGPGTGSGTIS